MSHSTERRLEQLHEDFGFKKEPLRSGTSEKAMIGLQFQRFFSSAINTLEGLPPSSKEQIETLETLIDEAPNRMCMLESLRSVLGDELFFPAIVKYVESVAGEKDFYIFLRQFSQRIQTIRSLTWLDQFSTREEKDIMVLVDVMRFGVSNIINNAFSFLEIIPHTFQNQYGRLPTTEEYEVIARSIEPLILCLASTHDEIFTTLFNVLRTFIDEDRKRDGPFPWPAFNASDYVLEGPVLEIRDETIARTRRWLQRLWAANALNNREVRIGCTAKFLIPVIYRRCHDLALEIFPSRFKHLVTLSAR